MIPEIGHFALILAMLMALIQGTLPLIGVHKRRLDWIFLAKPAAKISFILVGIAFLALSYSFYLNDFSVRYVAEHSNVLLPLAYRLSAVWGGHEGSLLLWIFFLTLWTLAVVVFSRSLDEWMLARVLGVLGLINLGLLLFVLLTSNPFERLFPAARDGRDLNPLLQDPGLVLHPPMLYMGYVGFSVAFAFAIASLLAGKLDAAWARWSRPWTIIAWVFLTLGIALGSWWAYDVLGWGGWWFWDPVENASFIPWLVGTALLHALAVTEKRGSFKNWTVLLAIIAFSLSLLGTFLVRSGVLTSVHAFATDPQRGVFILILLALVVGSSLTLYAWRASRNVDSGTFHLFSRETLILIGNVCLMVAAASVLLGTLYPLILDALDLGKISVGPPYFNAVFIPIMLPVLILMAIGPLAYWKKIRWSDLNKRLWKVALLSILSSITMAIMSTWLLGPVSWLIVLGFLCSSWVASSVLVQIIQALKQKNTSRSFWGMQCGHLGVAVFVFGVTMVGGFEQEKDVRVAPGDIINLAGYQFLFQGTTNIAGPNYNAVRGTFELRQDNKKLNQLLPEKRNFFSSTMPMTEASIDRRLLRDIYVSLAEPLADQAWAVRVYYKPFVSWIWAGCLLMAIGGVCSTLDRRYRLKALKKEDIKI